MKIVFVSTLLPPKFIGGAEIFTKLLAESLAEKHQVVIYTSGDNKQRKYKGVLIKEIKELNFPNFLRSLFMPLSGYLLHRRLSQEKFFLNADVIHATDLDSILALGNWKRIKSKFSAIIQDYGLICPEGSLLFGEKVCPFFCHQGKGFSCLSKAKLSFIQKKYFSLAYNFRKIIRDRTSKNLTNAICVSNFVKKEINTFNRNLNIEVIGNCLPKDWLIKKKVETFTRSIDVLYVGKLEQYKGIEGLLKALKIVLRKRKKLKIVFVGGGNIKKWQDYSRNLDMKEISFIEEVDFLKVKNYYQKAKIVVAPSLWPEPCGRAIIEGMFWGNIVIGTNQGGTPELISNNKNGFLVPPNDINKLAKVIIKILENEKLRKEIAQQAKLYAQKNFSPKKISESYDKYYSLLLSKK